jgi:hypothetical protein
MAAWHNSNDPVRKEAFLLKQVKTPELWQGNLIHRGIELFVVPAWQAHRAVSWPLAIEQTSEMARRQFEFSAARRYLEAGMTKAKAGDDYCALAIHEGEATGGGSVLASATEVVERSLTNLSEMSELLGEIEGRGEYWPELEVRVTYDAAAIEAHIDLLFFKEYGKPTIVDWKISESQGGSDADLQTALYAWALCQHPSWHVGRAEDCELLEVQLLKKTVLRHRVDQDTFDRLEDRIYRSVDRMIALTGGERFSIANLERFDFAANANSCVFCNMRSLCRNLAANAPLMPATTPAGNTRRKKAHELTHPQLF